MTWRAPAPRDGLLAFILLGVTGIAALSVHVVLQQVLGVPFPQVAGVPVYAKLLRPVSGTLALMVFSRWCECHAWCRSTGRHVFLGVPG